MLLLLLLLLITLYLFVINEGCSKAHGAHVEFVWWGGVVGWGVVCTVIFMSNPTKVLRLCGVVLSLAL